MTPSPTTPQGAEPREDGCRYVDGRLDLTHVPSLGVFIGKSLASFVSRNRMPEISGDDRKRIPDHERRRYDPACERIAEQILSALSPAPAAPTNGGGGEGFEAAFRSAMSWIDEVYPSTLPWSGAQVEVTWEKWNTLRAVLGYEPLEPKKPGGRSYDWKKRALWAEENSGVQDDAFRPVIEEEVRSAERSRTNSTKLDAEFFNGKRAGLQAAYRIFAKLLHAQRRETPTRSDREVRVIPREPTDHEVSEILYNINRKRNHSELTEHDVREVMDNYFYNVGHPDPTLQKDGTEVNHLLRILQRISVLGRPSGWPSNLWNEVCAHQPEQGK